MRPILSILLFIIGLVILLKGADWTTIKAERIAKYFGVSNLVIGLTLVAISTSLPELAVSVTASALNSGGISIGNVVGSNIANIGLVLGISLIITPTLVDKKNLEEASIMFVLMIVAAIYIYNGVGRIEGSFLLVFIGVYLGDLVKHRRKLAKYVVPGYDIKKEFLVFTIGVAGVILGSRILVDSTISIASIFNISEIVISATAIAIGTSLPELSVSLSAGKKGFKQMAIGNIIGSNIFNIAGVLAISAIVRPVMSSHEINFVDVPIMVILAGLLLVFMRTKWELSRKEGAVFLAIYAIFILLQII